MNILIKGLTFIQVFFATSALFYKPHRKIFQNKAKSWMQLFWFQCFAIFELKWVNVRYVECFRVSTLLAILLSFFSIPKTFGLSRFPMSRILCVISFLCTNFECLKLSISRCHALKLDRVQSFLRSFLFPDLVFLNPRPPLSVHFGRGISTFGLGPQLGTSY